MLPELSDFQFTVLVKIHEHAGDAEGAWVARLGRDPELIAVAPLLALDLARGEKDACDPYDTFTLKEELRRTVRKLRERGLVEVAPGAGRGVPDKRVLLRLTVHGIETVGRRAKELGSLVERARRVGLS